MSKSSVSEGTLPVISDMSTNTADTSEMEVSVSTKNRLMEPSAFDEHTRVKNFVLCSSTLLPAVDLTDPVVWDRIFTSMNKQEFGSVSHHPLPPSHGAQLKLLAGVDRTTSEEDLRELVANSWQQAPLHTLKLIAHIRHIREGKGLRLQYQQCLYWLYINHPRTLYENLKELVKFGYWKDTLQLLTTILFDGYIHPYYKADDDPKYKRKLFGPKKSIVKRLQRHELNGQRWKMYPGGIKAIGYNTIDKAKESRVDYDAEKRIYNQKIANHYGVSHSVKYLKLNKMKEYKKKFAREKLQTDLKYAAFHLKVAELFATQLIADLKELNKPEQEGQKNVSLAAKWAPSLEKHFDNYTLIGSTIALKIAEFTDNYIFHSGKPLPVITYVARKEYVKEYCVPLRKHLEITEQLTSNRQWGSINYSEVPSKCMNKNKPSFEKHDSKRFAEYLKSTPNKKHTPKVLELFNTSMELFKEPHQSIAIRSLKKKWDAFLKKLASSSTILKNAVTVCDVSNSMEELSKQVAVAISLLTMALASPPWKDVCLTMSEHPTLFRLHINKGKWNEMPYMQQLQEMRKMPFGGTPNLQAIFEQVVAHGKKHNLTDQEMPKALMILTDSPFEKTFLFTSVATFAAAKAVFESEGFTMPKIVHWDLKECEEAEVTAEKDENGVIHLTGISNATLNHVIQAGHADELDANYFVLKIVNNPAYGKLAIFD